MIKPKPLTLKYYKMKISIRDIKRIKDPQEQIDFVVTTMWYTNINQTLCFFRRYMHELYKAYNLLDNNYTARYFWYWEYK